MGKEFVASLEKVAVSEDKGKDELGVGDIGLQEKVDEFLEGGGVDDHLASKVPRSKQNVLRFVNLPLHITRSV